MVYDGICGIDLLKDIKTKKINERKRLIAEREQYFVFSDTREIGK